MLANNNPNQVMVIFLQLPEDIPDLLYFFDDKRD